MVSSFTSSNVGDYCASGAWIDLAPYLKQSKIDVNQFPAASRYYTQYNGKRCALPVLADSYGLYYNKPMLAKAGFKAPPKTLAELTAMAKKLTVRNADGRSRSSASTRSSGSSRTRPAPSAPSFGAKWVDADGKSTLASDPAWGRLFQWQKDLIDFYGYDKLVKWQAGVGDEFSAKNAFESGSWR